MSARCLLSLLLLVSPLAASAAADEPDLAAAKSLYAEARFAEAIPLLQQAVRALEPQRADAAVRSQLAEAYLHLGLSYFALRDLATAKDAFRNVLRLDASRRLDPDVYAPKLVELFEQARLALTAAGSLPEGAALALPRPPPRQLRFALEANSSSFELGERRRPHPGFPDSRFTRVDSRPFAYQPHAFGPELRAGVRLPRGRLALAYRRGEAETGLGDGRVFFVEDGDQGRTQFAAAEQMDFQVFDLTWSGVHGTWGPLAVRRELGYRHLRLDQEIHDSSLEERDGRALSEGVYQAESRLRAHGLRGGAAFDLALGGRWHLDFGGGLTLYLAGKDRVHVLARRATTPTGETTFGPSELSSSYGGNTQWDFGGRLRVNLARGWHLGAGYRWER
ncbi:MAG TPA: tetratricopeptide repeat protein, partial [Vicinamibacteria bacterium]